MARFVVTRGATATQDAALITAQAATGGIAVTNKALASNVATLTVPTGHGLVAGNVVTVEIADAIFNGVFTLTSVTATTIVYALTHADVSSAATTGSVLLGSISITHTLTASEDGSVTRIYSFSDGLANVAEAFSQIVGVGGTLFNTDADAVQHARTVSQGQ